MKIAVDLSFIRPDHTNGGTESCIKNLIKGWIQMGVIENFYFFIHQDIYLRYHDLFPECDFLVYCSKGSHKIRTTIFQTFFLPHWVKQYKVDILYYPTYTTGYYLHLDIPVVVNPHDIQFKFYPEYFSRLKRCYLDLGYRHSLKKANKIIAISHYVEGTLKRFYGQECGDKLITVYDPVDFSRREEKELNQIKGPFILSVSSIQKHKNIITLIKAFEQICNIIPHQLVIVGCKGNGMDRIRHYLEEKEIGERILFTDFIEGAQLNWLYCNASLYVTTSLYEGFGMTPIEAMGRGIPTICSKSTSLPEVTMQLAQYYEHAEDEDELAGKIKEVLQDERFKVPDPQLFIKQYDKKQIAMTIYQLFEKIVEEGNLQDLRNGVL